MQLKGSKTHDNLKAAFAGESQANRRYLYFAAKADVEGQNDVAALFRSTAEGETGHAHGHLEFLEQSVGDPATGLPIGSSRQNLMAAVAGETHEYTDMYPGMAKMAREEASTRSPTGSRRSPRPSARTPIATRRRSTRWSTEAASDHQDKGPRGPLFVDGEAMTLREGNLEAPTRHPIDWQAPDYRDEGKALAEMERVFDICHGCRRCVSLCNAFPTLFDLVDATDDGEVHGLSLIHI